MKEVYFDTQTGAIVSYEDAVARIESNPSAPVTPLAPLIEAKKLPFRTDHLTPRDTSQWERKDYMAFGKWVMAVLADGTDEPVALRERHFDRLRELGLGPSVSGRRFTRLFGRLNLLKMEIGSPIEGRRGLYASWVLADFVRHARAVARSVGGKPIEADYNQFAAKKRGPGYRVIVRRVGGVLKLHEYIGYPNIRDWDHDDYIAWGMRVVRANPTTGITCRVVTALSKRGRGPSKGTIANHFDTHGAFQAQVEKALQQDNEYRKQLLDSKLRECDRMIATGQLTAEQRALPLEELLAISGKRRVVESCAPNLSPHRKRELSMVASHNFVVTLLRAIPTITAGYIENIAVTLSVFDDIWPMDNSLEDLHVNLPPNKKRPAYYTTSGGRHSSQRKRKV